MKKKKQILQDQFKLMTKRCMYIITWPSLAITTIFGLYMLHENQILINLDWMKVKLVFVTIFNCIYCLLPKNPKYNDETKYHINERLQAKIIQ